MIVTTFPPSKDCTHEWPELASPLDTQFHLKFIKKYFQNKSSIFSFDRSLQQEGFLIFFHPFTLSDCVARRTLLPCTPVTGDFLQRNNFIIFANYLPIPSGNYLASHLSGRQDSAVQYSVRSDYGTSILNSSEININEHNNLTLTITS